MAVASIVTDRRAPIFALQSGIASEQENALGEQALASTLLWLFLQKLPPKQEEGVLASVNVLSLRVVIRVHYGDIGMGMQFTLHTPVTIFLQVHGAGRPIGMSADLQAMKGFMRTHVWEIYKDQMRSSRVSADAPFGRVLLQYHRVLPDERLGILAVNSGENLASCIIHDYISGGTGSFECYFTEGHRYLRMPAPTGFLL